MSGDAYIAASYEYYYSHAWRNFGKYDKTTMHTKTKDIWLIMYKGIMLGFLIGFLAIYFVAVEINSSTTSTAEVLVFRRGHVPKSVLAAADEENVEEKSGEQDNEANEEAVNAIPAQKDIFTWRDVVYDIPVKDGTRRLLDHVSGYVKPGTLTAL